MCCLLFDMPDLPLMSGDIAAEGGKTLAPIHYQSLEHGDIKTHEKFR